MPGEPDVTALASARLVAQSCSQNEEELQALADSRVAAMRDAVESAYEEWKREPTCAELYGNVGDTFGAGGLGLMGVGEGGGGQGEGIGLGSIGTIGHGSGQGPVVRSSATRATRASGTNDQVAGVDEADIVKNDGAYVYVVSNKALRIIEAMHPRLLSVTPLPGDVKELLVQGDRAVAFVATGGTGARPCTYGYDCSVAGDGSQTELVVLDVADRGRPRIVRRLSLSGSLIAARRIGNTVHTVVADGDAPEAPSYETWPSQIPGECKVKGMDPAAVRARFTQLERANEKALRAQPAGFPTLTELGTTRPLCDVLRTPLGDGKAFTTLVSFDLRDDRTPASTAVVQSRPGVVFASEHGLYFAVTHRRSEGGPWYAFEPALDEVSDVHQFRIGETPGETRYVGSGVVPGHVLNQFAMDEWAGTLRVATTRGHVPDPAADSVVSVLSEAEGGSLLRVGAVDHLAPGEDIRAVRFDGDRGYVVTFKKTDPLFVLDLRDPRAPAVLGELQIPGFSTCEGGGDGTYGDRLAFSGLLVYEVTVDHGFRRLGGVHHGTAGASCSTWWAEATSHVKRSIFMDDLVFSIATDRMKVQRLERLGQDLADVPLGP